MIDQIEKSNYYQLARDYIEELRFSVGYTAEIVFNNDRKLSSYKFEIRHTGKQRRHVSPIGLVESIILQALRIGNTPSQIFEALWLKIQVFKADLDPNASGDIQKVFDYFKHPQYLNAEGINRLIKILANFYHDNFYLTFDDDHIKIPYKTNDCCLVPTLSFGGTQYIHQGEGSFIKALLKILDNFEKKVGENQTLSQQEIHQMNYSVFAMFDFLPLPKGTKKLSSKPNIARHRYKNETIERLNETLTTHLLFIFEAYPNLNQKYSKEITQAFFSYVTKGVSEKRLLALFQKEDIEEVVEILDEKSEHVLITIADVQSNFTNQGKKWRICTAV